jgi:hypothetical protein
MTPPDACSGVSPVRKKRATICAGYQDGRVLVSAPKPLSGSLLQSNNRLPDDPPAKSPREPDRVRFVIEIDMECHAGVLAAVAKAVWLDPSMVEPSPHFRH